MMERTGGTSQRTVSARPQTGMALSRVLPAYTDADGQFDLRELPALLPHAARADIVAGYRLRRHDPWFRRLYALVFGRLLVRAVLGVRDLNCAFKLIRRDLVAGPPPQVRRRPHQRRAARQGAARRRTRHRGGRAPLPAPGGNADGRQPARDYARVPGTPCAARGDPGAARQAGPLSGALSPLERSVSASV